MLNYVMGLTFDPRAKPGVVNRIWQTMAACSCNAIRESKLNLPLHVSTLYVSDFGTIIILDIRKVPMK